MGPPSASTDETPALAPQLSTKRDNEGSQSGHKYNTILQPQCEGISEAPPTKSVPLQDQSPPQGVAPAPASLRDSQETTEQPLQDEEISEDQNAVEVGIHYPVPLDVDSQDSDSAIGMELQSSIVSLRSSLYEYIEENGRTYHKYKEGNYLLPNDEVEQSRLDLQHHLFLLTLDGKLGLAPVTNPRYALDIGTGTGIWAIEYANQHPEASVTGVDLSPIQPAYVPPNCQFEVDDLEDEWTYSRLPDYIHGRAMFTCFKDPKMVFQRAYDALAPGGYFEMQDLYFKPHSNDGTTDGTHLEEWNNLLIKGAAKIGRDWHCTAKYAQWFREIGFVDVVEHKFAWPNGTWPKGKKQKTMGLWTMTNGLDGVNSISMAMMTRALGMPHEEVEVYLVDVRKDIKSKAIHAYYPVYVVYGRKPL